MKGKNGGLKACKQYVELFMLMLGSVVGVGFISGAEVVHNFARFGVFGFFGLGLFFVLFFVLTNKILINTNFNQTEAKLLNKQEKSLKNTFLTKFQFKQFLIFLTVLLIASAMFSGLKILLKQLFFDNYLLIYFFCVVFVYALLLCGVNGLSKFNFVLILFVVFVLIFLSFNTNFDHISLNFNMLNGFYLITNSLIFSFLFVFMNIVELQPVANEFNLKFNKFSAKIFSFLFSLSITLILMVFMVFLICNENITNQAMPLLTFFSSKGIFFQWFFVVGLLAGLLSTLVACLLGVKRSIFNKSNSNFFASSVAIMLSLLLSYFDFSFYVSVIYPIIGIINFVIYVFL